jgi:hypothetical protein
MRQAAPSPPPPWVERVLGRPGQWTSLVWGFAEGTFFFIVPDVPLSLAAMFRARRALLHLALAIAGAVLAGALMYAWAAASPAAARGAVEGVPYVRERMFDSVEEQYRQWSAAALFIGPRYGIPYKVYAVLAPEHISPAAFLLITVPARLERLLLSWLFFALAGWALRKTGHGSPRVLLAAHAACWTAFYVYYWATI